jgi:hypothetical protein
MPTRAEQHSGSAETPATCSKCQRPAEVKGGYCKECKKEYDKVYRKERKEERKLKNQAYNNTLDGRWSRTRISAKQRGLEFAISKSLFDMLTQLPCLYCGGPGGGLDRVDSCIGYVPGNVVSCCKRYNQAKNDMAWEDFVEWVDRVYNHIHRKDK